MDQPIFVILIVVAVLSVIIYGSLFSKKAVIKRKLKKAPYRRLNDFYDGEMARIVGEVEFIGEPLRSPLTNRQCAYYYVHVEQEVSSGKSSRWKTIIEEEVSGKFIVRDGLNCAVINDSLIKSYIVQDKKFSSGFLNDATATLRNYLRKHGYDSENMLGLNKRLRYKEGVLERGEEIAVSGKGRWKTAVNLNLPEKYGTVLELTGNDGIPVYLSDDPKTCVKE